MLPIIHIKFKGRNGARCVSAVVDWRNIVITLTALVIPSLQMYKTPTAETY